MWPNKIIITHLESKIVIKKILMSGMTSRLAPQIGTTLSDCKIKSLYEWSVDCGESSDSNRSCSILFLIPMINRRSTLMTRFFRRFLITCAYIQIEFKKGFCGPRIGFETIGCEDEWIYNSARINHLIQECFNISVIAIAYNLEGWARFVESIVWRSLCWTESLFTSLAEITPPSPMSRFVLRMAVDISHTKLAMILTFFVLATSISYRLILHKTYS